VHCPRLFFVSEASPDSFPERILQCHEHLQRGRFYYFWTFRGGGFPFRLYLERHRRLTVDTPSGTKYIDCPFDLGLRPWPPTQTWDVSYGSWIENTEQNHSVQWETPIGLSVGGTNKDDMQADGRQRRLLTVSGCTMRVLPSTWGNDERFQLVKAGNTSSNLKFYSTNLFVSPIPDICEAGHTMVYSPKSIEVAPLITFESCTVVEFDFWTSDGRMYVKSEEIPFALVIPIFVEDNIKDEYQVAPLRALCERNSGRWFSFRLYVAYAADFICGSEQPRALIEIFMRDGKGHRDHTITCDPTRNFAIIQCAGAVIDTRIKEYPRYPDKKKWYVCLT